MQFIVDFWKWSVHERKRSHTKQELNGRAAGESQVRQALSELEQWDIETRWTLSNHVDSNGKQVSLIKEYKELLNKVGPSINTHFIFLNLCFFCFDQVGENLSLIQSVKDSTYYQAYSDRITLWETKMTDLDFLLRHLSQIQLKLVLFSCWTICFNRISSLFPFFSDCQLPFFFKPYWTESRNNPIKYRN